jgi:Peptidase family S41/Tricorn protease C1 domain
LSPARIRGHRLGACLLATLLFVAALPAAADDDARERREDFEALARIIDTRYAYLDRVRAQWRRARETWRPRAAQAQSREDFVGVLEAALGTLRDDHVSLSERTPASPRRIPAETDLWAHWKGGVATIESVRVAGDADVAGVRPGDIVTRIDGVAVGDVVDRMLAAVRRPTAADRDWALRHALAGPRDGRMVLDLGGASPRRVEIERSSKPPAPTAPLIARRMGQERDLGYVRLKNLEDPALPEQLDGALGYLRDARALMVDLRDATSGSRAVTLAVLARLAHREAAWQQREARNGKRMLDRVSPHGGIYRGPVVVLVDRWTAGEGEALAAGLAAVADARLVGTPMAALRGELHEAKLPHSGIVVRFPGEKTFHVDGTPRETLRPAIMIDPSAPSGGPGDPILYQALKLLEK